MGLVLFVAIDNCCERFGLIGMRIDTVQFARLDQGSDGAPVCCFGVVARAERVFAVQSFGTDRAFRAFRRLRGRVSQLLFVAALRRTFRAVQSSALRRRGLSWADSAGQPPPAITQNKAERHPACCIRCALPSRAVPQRYPHWPDAPRSARDNPASDAT